MAAVTGCCVDSWPASSTPLSLPFPLLLALVAAWWQAGRKKRIVCLTVGKRERWRSLFVCLPAVECKLRGDYSLGKLYSVLGTQAFRECFLLAFTEGEEQVWGKTSRVRVKSILSLGCLLGILVEK